MNANKSKKVGDIFQVMQNILKFYHTHGFYEAYAKELEYFCVKIALCSSLSRIGRVTDKELEGQLLDETFAMYDETRLGEALLLLEKQQTQVFLFTCQKREEEILQKMGIMYQKVVL